MDHKCFSRLICFRYLLYHLSVGTVPIVSVQQSFGTSFCFFLVFYLTCSPIVFGFAAILPRFMFSLFLLSFLFCCVSFSYFVFAAFFLATCFPAFSSFSVFLHFFLVFYQACFFVVFSFSLLLYIFFLFSLHEIFTPNCFRLTNPFTVYSCTPD